MNILVNGIEAIEERYFHWGEEQLSIPLEITIRTCLIDKNQVEIAIADTGIGMDSKVSDRIFEPFYTTKPIGVGTGLGMSITYEIVTGVHQGEIQCESTPGKGTLFVIRIPARQP